MASTADSGSSAFRTSASLVMRVQANEERAWGRLVDLYGPLVFSWGRRGGLQGEDAADLVQDVFCAVARAIARFDPDASGRFRGWLWTIARNKIHDFHRKRLSIEKSPGGSSAYRALTELADQLPDRWNDDESEVTRREVQALYHRALKLIQADFQPQTWQAFWLSVVEEVPTSEVATRLELSENSVRQARSRVLRRLRQELAEERFGG